MTELPYHEQRDRKNEAKLQELLSTLPPFCADFFVELNQQLLLGHELLMLMI